MGGRLLKAKNSFRLAVYQFQPRSFNGNVPILTEARSSWEGLLEFLLRHVVDHCYDSKQKFFRLPSGPQVSWQGARSDAMELSLRSFIGVSYLARHASYPEFEEIYLDMIRQGVDPKSKHFWGRLPGYQMLVENLTLLTGVFLNPDKFWEPLTKTERANFLDYVTVCCGREFVDNNWLWSKIFHLLFIQRFGEKQDLSVKIRGVLKRIDNFYAGGGWYRDGLDEFEFRYDHYNSWVMHYYGLLFCSLAGSEFEDIKAILRGRFLDFKRSYLLIFSRDHLPVAWGRSLIYRFGMLSCFGVALENQLLDEQEVKDLRTLSVETINHFFPAGILDQHGLLTMGFTQVNRNVLEGYSGTGSPYWALKAFSFLIADPKDDFWKGPLEIKVEKTKVEHVKTCGLSFQKYTDGHSLVINAGMGSRLYSEKYNRFAFSNAFPLSFDQRCLDNCLTVFVGSQLHAFDLLDEVRPIEDGVTAVKWRISSLPDIKAEATIVAVPHGYVGILNVNSKERLKYRFGGFCFTSSDAASKAATLLRIYRSGKGQVISNDVSPKHNTLGVKGRVEYFESFLETGNNELVFASLASLSGKPSEPVYQDRDGKITIEAENFSRTFNKVL